MRHVPNSRLGDSADYDDGMHRTFPYLSQTVGPKKPTASVVHVHASHRLSTDASQPKRSFAENYRPHALTSKMVLICSKMPESGDIWGQSAIGLNSLISAGD